MDLFNLLTPEELKNIGMSLAAFVGKATASSVNTKIKTIRAENDIEQRSRNYEEIITELLSEREEAIRIAQIYKSELERITISDEDISHLHNTISGVLEIVKMLEISKAIQKGDGSQGMVKAKIENYEAIKNLISIDTIKTMQLLGFNYKAAIGEPLTELCSNAISSLGKNKSISSNNKRK